MLKNWTVSGGLCPGQLYLPEGIGWWWPRWARCRQGVWGCWLGYRGRSRRRRTASWCQTGLWRPSLCIGQPPERSYKVDVVDKISASHIPFLSVSCYQSSDCTLLTEHSWHCSHCAACCCITSLISFIYTNTNSLYRANIYGALSSLAGLLPALALRFSNLLKN